MKIFPHENLSKESNLKFPDSHRTTASISSTALHTCVLNAFHTHKARSLPPTPRHNILRKYMYIHVIMEVHSNECISPYEYRIVPLTVNDKHSISHTCKQVAGSTLVITCKLRPLTFQNKRLRRDVGFHKQWQAQPKVAIQNSTQWRQLRSCIVMQRNRVTRLAQKWSRSVLYDEN